MREVIDQFRSAFAAHGLTAPEDIEADGKLHRFSASGRRGDDSGYYVLHLDGIPAGHIGDFRSGISETWHPDIGRSMTDEERRQHRQRVDDMRQAREADNTRRRAAAAEMASTLWRAGAPAGADNPYLIRKGVKPVETLREIDATELHSVIGYRPQASGEPLTGRILLAPVKIGGKLSSIEMIDEGGRKSALAGGAKAGGFWAAQAISDVDAGRILIGEGVATALSAHEATGQPAIAALSAGQIEAAARAVRRRLPAASIVILADLTKDAGKPDPRAVQAAQAVGAALAIPDFGSNRKPTDTDFNDMAAHAGHEAVKRAIDAAIASPGCDHAADAPDSYAGDAEGWAHPMPLVAKVAPEPYPIDALPDIVRSAVQEVAGFVKAPVPMVASAALAALSLAIQAHSDAKRAERLHGPIGLFMLTIADSGERKSTCDGFFTAAIRDYEQAQAESAKPVLADHKAALESWEAKRAGVKEKIRQLAKDSKPTVGFESALRDLEHDKPMPPRVARLLYADATPEALAYGLAKQWPSGGVISAEAGVVFGSHGMGKDSVMRNLALLNQLWDGASLTIDRRSTESFTVRGARLTIALQVQEPTLREFFIRSGALARGTGFLARFLVAWPESTQGNRPFSEAPANWPALAAFNRRIAEILDRPVPIDDDGTLTPLMLPLTPEAKHAWVAYHDAIEGELGGGGELHDVRDVASKSADNATRLAALFQVFDGSVGAIGIEAFASASRIAAWHLHEARRFFGELATPTDLADALALDGWLIEQCRRDAASNVPRRDAQRFGPVRDGDRLTAALRILAELDRVRESIDGKRRTIIVNPSLPKATTQ